MAAPTIVRAGMGGRALRGMVAAALALVVVLPGLPVQGGRGVPT